MNKYLNFFFNYKNLPKNLNLWGGFGKNDNLWQGFCTFFVANFFFKIACFIIKFKKNLSTYSSGNFKF